MRQAVPAIALTLAALLAACATEPAPPDEFYRFDIADGAVPGPAAPVLPGTLEIARPSAEGLAGERPVVYSLRRQPREVRNYRYGLWADPPTQILQDQLVRYLRAANAAEIVVTPELRLPADYVVEGRIRRFEQVIGSPTVFVAEIELSLIRLEDDELLLLNTYRAERPAADDSLLAAARAAEEAVADIAGRFLADVAATAAGS